MSAAAVVFPHQLFACHPGLARGRRVLLVEDQLLFRDWRCPARFHQHKLVFHRASMRAYAARLRRAGYEVSYIDYAPDPAMEYLFAPLRRAGISELHVAELTDYLLERRLRRFAQRHGMRIVEHASPGFLTPRAWLDEYTAETPQLQLTPFYIAQRRRLGLLLDHGKPAGGRWTFDTQNRQPLPRGISIPPPPSVRASAHTAEAVRYVQQRFADHPGTTEGLWMATTHDDAARWLEDFVTHRLAFFGPYEDAMAAAHPFLFHSLLSPLLNAGLLTPAQVVEATCACAAERAVPLASLEGFLRQVIGWREFMRAVYLRDGVRQRTTNHFGFTRALPPAFYTGTTGIEPFDHVVQRVQNLAYAHHIERLMVLGNFMLLCNMHPDAVYTWFMELFLDAYDWVMVPNVYGMSQYADGGRMTTKPYISGSRYIRTMGDFAPGPWCEVWDALYWRFVDQQRATLLRVPRAAMMPRLYDRLAPARRAALQRTADAFLPRSGD